MIRRRVMAGLLTLMAVQFAALGAQPMCADAHHGASSPVAVGGMSHEGPTDHGPAVPCAPTAPDAPPTHSLMSCLAMTGCAPTGLASPGTVDVTFPPMIAQTLVRDPASLRSIVSPPETPPPIA